jgi:hypothetical protein
MLGRPKSEHRSAQHDGAAVSPQHGALPTLTEVIEIEADAVPAAVGQAPLPPESLPLESPSAVVADTGVALTTQVLEALRPRVDALLEARLREVLAPQLARLADEAVQCARGELAAALHTLVAQAVAEVLARRRKP